jgi:hypothetical protein
MEYVVDWHLVYRDTTVLASLKPEKAAAEFLFCALLKAYVLSADDQQVWLHSY